MAVKVAALRRGMVGAFKTGWAVETNWAHPIVNAFFQVLRPLGGALILVFIYKVAAGPAARTDLLGWLMVGAALWSYVMSALQGISFAVVQEREWLRVLKYVVLTPMPFPIYLMSRTGTWVVWGTIRAAFVLAVTTLALGLGITLGGIDWLALGGAMVVGLIGLVGLGMGLAGIALGVARHPFGVGEGVIGVMYLLSGAIFPISGLPSWLQPVAKAHPLTYWIEACRQAILPNYDPTGIGIADPWGMLWITTAAAVVVGGATFVFYDRKARRDGLYDKTTEY